MDFLEELGAESAEERLEQAEQRQPPSLVEDVLRRIATIPPDASPIPCPGTGNPGLATLIWRHDLATLHQALPDHQCLMRQATRTSLEFISV